MITCNQWNVKAISTEIVVSIIYCHTYMQQIVNAISGKFTGNQYC